MGGSIGATQGSDGSPYRRSGEKSTCHCNCSDCYCACHRHEEPKVAIWQRGKEMMSRIVKSFFFQLSAVIVSVLGFVFFLCFLASNAQEQAMSQPCDAYSNYKLGEMPARCIKQYSDKTVIVNNGK